MLHIKQYDGSNVSAKDDAKFYQWLTNNENGVISGFRCTILAGNKLSISDGEIMIQGRMIESIGSEIDVQLNTTQTVGYGRIYIEIDTTKPLSEAVKLQSHISNTLPALKQEPINKNGTIYQWELARYTATNFGIQRLENTAPQLTLQKERLDNLYTIRQDSVQVYNPAIGLPAGGVKWTYVKSGFIVTTEPLYLNAITLKANNTYKLCTLPYALRLRQYRYIGDTQVVCLIDYDGNVSLQSPHNRDYTGNLEIPNITYVLR